MSEREPYHVRRELYELTFVVRYDGKYVDVTLASSLVGSYLLHQLKRGTTWLLLMTALPLMLKYVQRAYTISRIILFYRSIIILFYRSGFNGNNTAHT